MHRLNKGFIVIVLHDYNHKNGHVEETRYVAENKTNKALILPIENRMPKSPKLALSRISCGPENDSFPVPASKCLPFLNCMCFATPTKNAQGQLFGGKKESIFTMYALLWSVKSDGFKSYSPFKYCRI